MVLLVSRDLVAKENARVILLRDAVNRPALIWEFCPSFRLSLVSRMTFDKYRYCWVYSSYRRCVVVVNSDSDGRRPQMSAGNR